MAKFGGKVGFGVMSETDPGVWVEVITEKTYFGDVVRANRQLQEGERLHDDVKVNNAISIVADAHANAHVFAIRYVEWAGVRWKVSNVEIERPRLILQLGEVYNGPTPA